MRIEGGKTGTSWESLFPAAPSPFSKLYKLVKLGKEGHDDDEDEEDSVEELLGQLLCDDFCSDDDDKSVQPVVVFPTRIIRAGA